MYNSILKQPYKILRIVLIALITITTNSCQKYLEERPFKFLNVPDSLEDLQALMNERSQLNSQNTGLPETLSDNYYISNEVWKSATESHGKFLYAWEAESQSKETWNTIYKTMIYYPNVVLDLLPTIKSNKNNEVEQNNIHGQALFFRAFAFYQLAQVYCKPYSASAATDLGLPLRTTAAIDAPSIRSTVQETYDKIIGDLTLSIDLLPSKVSIPTQPSKIAAYGLLARCYLSMRDYANAGNFADLCLKEYGTLMDYNDVPMSDSPFRRFNAETIYYSFCINAPAVSRIPRARVDTLLYDSYDANDLRKTLFFKASTGANAGSYEFKGGYDGDYYPNGIFNGITTGEMYLIRSECYAHDDKKELALVDLNTLMKMRWDNTVSYPTITASSAAEAVEKILIERRKELVYRNQRWTDIRRFNMEGANITLKRVLEGKTYTLPPNDLRWVLLIPDDALHRSGMKQNPRD